MLSPLRTRMLWLAGLTLAGATLLPAGGGTAGSQELDCRPQISLGESVECSIDRPGEERTHEFTGARGERVAVRMTADNLSPYFEVRRPDGSLECGPGYGDIESCTLDVSGTHAILVQDAYESKTGTYRLSLLPPGEAGPGHSDDGGGEEAPGRPSPERSSAVGRPEVLAALIGALGAVLAAVLAAWLSRGRARRREG
jgi:hypothetical protein